MTLADRLRLLAFDLILLGWSARAVAVLYEAEYQLRQIDRPPPSANVGHGGGEYGE